MFRRTLSPLAAGLLAAAAVGCSKGGSYATVSGVVTHNGTPVDGARVIFHPTTEVDGKVGTSFSSLTDSSGKYLIGATERSEGLPTGVYKVTVTKYDGKVPVSEAMDAGQLDAQMSDTGGAGGKGGPVNLLPKEYAQPGSTKLSATLDTGKNEVNFALKGEKGK